MSDNMNHDKEHNAYESHKGKDVTGTNGLYLETIRFHREEIKFTSWRYQSQAKVSFDVIKFLNHGKIPTFPTHSFSPAPMPTNAEENQYDR